MPSGDAVRHLCSAFTQAFPVKVNMEKITACKQKDGENPDEYLTCLTEVFNTHSGLQLPGELSNAPAVWEIHLCNCFLSGLKPNIASAVKRSSIGWNDACLSELRRHAIHAHDQILSNKREKEEKTQKEPYMAAITMYNTVRDHGQQHDEDRGRGRNRNWEWKTPRDVCYLWSTWTLEA